MANYNDFKSIQGLLHTIWTIKANLAKLDVH